MPDIVEIAGDWIGFYTYGDDEHHTKVPFRMTVKRGINQFVGRIFEEKEFGGIDDEIIIKGHQNGDEIEFTKHYTLEHFSSETSSLISLESDNPTIVYYDGAFDYREKKFKGKWEIPGLREDDDGVFHEHNSKGYWEIWKSVDS